MDLIQATKVITIILNRLMFKNRVNIETIYTPTLSLFQLFDILLYCNANNVEISSLSISDELNIILSNTNAMLNWRD